MPDDAQGELQGALSSGQSVMAVVSPLLMTQIFGAFAAPGADSYLPGAPFLAAALDMGWRWRCSGSAWRGGGDRGLAQADPGAVMLCAAQSGGDHGRPL